MNMIADNSALTRQFRHKNNDDKYYHIIEKLDDFLKKGQPDKAKEWLQTAIMENPGDKAFLLCQLGVVLVMLQDLNGAEESFLQVIELDDEIPESYYNLGLLYQNQKNYEKALTFYKSVIEINPNDTETYEMMGECCQALSNNRDAIAFYDAALRLNPKSLNAAVNLAHLYLQEHNEQSAIDVLKIALVTFPQQQELHFALADIYKSQNELEHAIGHFRKVVALDPENSRAFYELGYCCLELGLVNQSIPLLAQAYKLDQHHSEALYYLGKAYETKKNKESAISFYEKWVEMEKSQINLYGQDKQSKFNVVCQYIADYYRSVHKDQAAKFYTDLIVAEKSHPESMDATSFTVDD